MSFLNRHCDPPLAEKQSEGIASSPSAPRNDGTLKGFALLEILISLLLFSAGIVAVAGLYATALDSGLDAEQTAIAVNVARARMEQANNFVYDPAQNNETRTAVTVGNLTLYRTTAQTELMSPVGLKQVTVTVFWTIKGKETSISLVTYGSST